MADDAGQIAPYVVRRAEALVCDVRAATPAAGEIARGGPSPPHLKGLP